MTQTKIENVQKTVDPIDIIEDVVFLMDGNMREMIIKIFMFK